MHSLIYLYLNLCLACIPTEHSCKECPFYVNISNHPLISLYYQHVTKGKLDVPGVYSKLIMEGAEVIRLFNIKKSFFAFIILNISL